MVTVDTEQLRKVVRELRRRERRTFESFVRQHNPTAFDFEHIPRLVSVGERIATGELRRVMVIMAPRYLKTEIFGRLLPAYYLTRHPSQRVGLTSYGADLAWSTSEEAKHYYEADGGKLSMGTSAKKHWRTIPKGEMWAAGVGGPLLGFGYHLGIVDDPTDPEKAHSPTYQKRFREWWPAKFLSRQERNARVIVVMQRLGVEDPIDFLFRREVGEHTEHAPEYWHVVLCDEIKSDEPLGRWDGPMGLPPTCTFEPDDRHLGDILAPTRFSREAVESMQRAAGPYVTSSQRQGRPMRPAGDFWKKVWFQPYDDLPDNAFNGGKDWDTAYTKEEANSASAFLESYRGPGEPGQFPIYIHDVDWEWLEFPELVGWMRSQAGPHYVEQKATGKSTVQVLRAEQIYAHEVPVKGDKFARSAAVQSVASNRRVFVHRPIYDRLMFGERQGLLRVTAEQLLTSGDGLDVNDVFVQALHRHAGVHNMRQFLIGR